MVPPAELIRAEISGQTFHRWNKRSVELEVAQGSSAQTNPERKYPVEAAGTRSGFDKAMLQDVLARKC